MVYTFYICNNEASANRFSSGNTFDIKEENLKNDKEAFEYALDLIDMLDMYEEDVDAEDLLYDQDTGEGNPVIYLIKRDEETIFDLDSDYFEKMRLSTEDDLNEDINFLDDNIEYKNHIIGKFNYDINYGQNYFPEKEYKGIIYPEGNYESLVITLGDGIGSNFWCVLFPPLCLIDNSREDISDVDYQLYVKKLLKGF